MNVIEDVVIPTGSFVLSTAWGIVTGTCVYRRLVSRLNRKGSILAEVIDIEKRREAYLSGRTEALREHAGPPARITNLFPIQPGTLAQFNIDNENVSE